MIHPCPIKSPCVPSNQFLGEDTPFQNITAEAPDVDLFLGSNFGWDLNVPRLGWIFTDTDSPAWCRGTTQQLADQCAGNLQLNNQVKDWTNQNGNPVPIFFNQQVQCPFTCPDGLLFIWTVPAGVFQAMDQETANSIALSFACQQALRFWICLGSLNPFSCVGQQYSSTVKFTGGKAPIGATVVSGSLPPGLLLSQGVDGRSVILSGTPSAAGTYPFTILATDANGNFMQKAYTLNVLGVSNLSSLPPATENTPYSFQLTGAGGTSPFTFNLVSGNLPGITLSPSGLLSGTPNYITAGTYPFAVSVTDANGNTCTQNGTLKVNLRPGPDWTKLVWSTYQLNQNPPGNTASGVAISNIAAGTLKTNGIFPNPSISPVAAGGVTYTGGAVTARIQVTVTTDTVFNSMCSRVLRNGVALGGPGCGPKTSGTFTADIAIPGGVNDVYTIDDVSPGNSFALLTAGGVTENLSFTWAIFNL